MKIPLVHKHTREIGAEGAAWNARATDAPLRPGARLRTHHVRDPQPRSPHYTHTCTPSQHTSLFFYKPAALPTATPLRSTHNCCSRQVEILIVKPNHF